MSPNPELPRTPDSVRDTIRRYRQTIEGRNVFTMTADEARRSQEQSEQLQRQLIEVIRDTEQRLLDEEIASQQRWNIGRGVMFGVGVAFAPLLPLAGVAAYSYFRRSTVDGYIDQRSQELLNRFGVRMEVVFDRTGNYRVRIEPVAERQSETDLFQALRANHPDRQRTTERLTVDAQLATCQLAGLLRQNQRPDSPAITGLVASMREALGNIQRVDQQLAADLFHRMNQWLLDAGAEYCFDSTNPMELRIVESRESQQHAPASDDFGERVRRAFRRVDLVGFLQGGAVPQHLVAELNRRNMNITEQEVSGLQRGVIGANLAQPDLALIIRALSGEQFTGHDQQLFEQLQRRLRVQLNQRQAQILQALQQLAASA